ncbi:MAG TPA: hypothetical protein IAD08_03445 [Candidatus Scatovivens faecipullorum]|nr:hypothetical protein [Candidatus Scatovivens faecipullorum]
MKKKIIIPIIIVLILLIMSIVVSFNKFSTFNPISSLCGVIEISITDKEYTIIQTKPWKVIVSKATNNDRYAQLILDEYMAERGYTTTDRMGSIIIYSNGINVEKVHFSVNKYYSVWEWI